MARSFNPDVAWLSLRFRARLEALRPDRELVELASTFARATVLEVGGPTALFRPQGRFPIYRHVERLDAADYAERTLWDRFEADEAVRFGCSFTSEARHLNEVHDGAYDALLASHVIEHLADPIGALREWHRVVRPGGHVIIVAPHRDGTFDHRRPVTPLGHLLADAEDKTDESDMTHLSEVLALHDLSRDPSAGDRSAFSARCRANFTYRAMHHHVFETRRLIETVESVGLFVYHVACRRPFHIVVLAGTDPRRALTEDDRSIVLASSPFQTDRSMARPFANRGVMSGTAKASGVSRDRESHTRRPTRSGG